MLLQEPHMVKTFTRNIVLDGYRLTIPDAIGVAKDPQGI